MDSETTPESPSFAEETASNMLKGNTCCTYNMYIFMNILSLIHVIKVSIVKLSYIMIVIYLKFKSPVISHFFPLIDAFNCIQHHYMMVILKSIKFVIIL